MYANMPLEAKEFFRNWHSKLSSDEKKRLADIRVRQTLHDDGAGDGQDPFLGLISFHDMEKSAPSFGYSFLQLGFVVTQINLVFLTKWLLQFVSEFKDDASSIARETLMITNFALSFGTMLVKLFFRRASNEGSTRFLGSFILLSVYLALTPVLLTLTEPYADDTVATLASLFLTLHLFSHDYFPPKLEANRQVPPRVVSLNAGVVATVLLASRLDSVLTAFFGISIGLSVIDGIPRLRDFLWHQRPAIATKIFSVAALGSSCVHAFVLLYHEQCVSYFRERVHQDIGSPWNWTQFAPTSVETTAAYGICLLFLWVVCPVVYSYLHHKKIVITGSVNAKFWPQATLSLTHCLSLQAMGHRTCKSKPVGH
mgnify:CR=1 FL=1